MKLTVHHLSLISAAAYNITFLRRVDHAQRVGEQEVPPQRLF